MDFLRNAYSETTNVQSIGTGRESLAIYGKLITFGEKIDLNGSDVNQQGETNTMFSYDVVGDVSGDIGSGNVLDMLYVLGANVAIKDKNDRPRLAGVAESYTPRWSARIQNTNNTDDFVGAILIVRHPRSGTVYTFVMKDATVPVNETMRTTGGNIADILKPYLYDRNAHHFETAQLDLCVNPTENTATRTNRVDVRLNRGARGSSGIQAIYDAEDNKCTE